MQSSRDIRCHIAGQINAHMHSTGKHQASGIGAGESHCGQSLRVVQDLASGGRVVGKTTNNIGHRSCHPHCRDPGDRSHGQTQTSRSASLLVAGTVAGCMGRVCATRNLHQWHFCGIRRLSSSLLRRDSDGLRSLSCGRAIHVPQRLAYRTGRRPRG